MKWSMVIMSPKTFCDFQKAVMPGSFCCDRYLGFEIIVDPHFADRNIKQRWVPTAWGQFTELTASDEPWARVFGLGKVVTEDLGPLVVFMK